MYEIPSPEDLRNYRLRAGLTQTELAAKAKVSQSLIARIEAGDIDPRTSTLKKILDALKAGEVKKELCAVDIMKSPVIHVKPNDTIGTANKLMEKYEISQLPVLENNAQVGSISEARVVKEISSGKDISKIPVKRIEEIMNDGFPTISKNTDIKTVSKMVEVNPAVLVVERGKVVGIITKADIIRMIE
ncbi:MAG: CBS domain-containing protein [Methanobacteriota archaeon]